MIARNISLNLSCFLLRAWTLTGSTLISLGFVTAAIAQPITSAPDGTGTVVNQQDNEYLITGGTQSGSNLFHSFEQFGINSGQTANFVGNPDLANILGRVTGGNVSVINGLLQVSNSDANLYLMNPAGFIFGTGAQLDLTGSFAAAAVNRIGFGDNNFFNSFGTNNYSELSLAPTSFVMDGGTGMILNEGNLAVQPDQSLWLIGSSVLNLGTLQGGNVSVTALPEERQIKISQDGNLLSLAIDAAPLGEDPSPDNLELFTPTDLPRYLTGGYEDKIAISELGEISLKQGEKLVPFNTGDVGIAGTVQAQNLQLMAAGRVTPTDTSLVQAGEEGVGGLTVVRFRESLEDALGYTFIDQRVDNPKELLYNGQSGAIATIILKQEGGLEAVTQALLEFAATGQKLDAINIVAEGNQGYFWLGNQLVNNSTLEQYQTQLQEWRSVLGEGADLLIYSCFTALGMDGEAFIKQLSDLTGTDVAASLDATGSENFGGNWDLEYSTGEIEAGNPFTLETLAVWEGKLATIIVGTLTDISIADAGDVCSGGGGASCELRDAIFFASPGDLITPTVSGDVVLTAGQINWTTDNLTLDATGQNFAIDANGSSRVLYLGNTTVNATIENITIKNGNSYLGGGIRFQGGGTLTLNNTTVTGNEAYSGGGISNFGGTLTLTNSTVSGNDAKYGGGIYNYGGTVTLTNSTVSGNTATDSGGGIFNYGGEVDLTNSTVLGNTAAYSGGGIFSEEGGNTVNITDSTVSVNTATYGGGLYIGDGEVLNLTRSTVSGNTATIDGGGIFSDYGSSSYLRNSTISGNNAANDGGGIWNYGDMVVENVTIAENSATRGGGFFNQFNEAGETTTITNSIIANNSASSVSNGDDVFIDTTGVVIFEGNNIAQGIVGSFSGTTPLNVDPRLKPLGNYGGSTQTHFLLMDSPAIDGGDNGAISSFLGSVDQRGGSRQVNTIDLGAVELQGILLTLISGSGQSTLINTNFSPIVVQAKENTFANLLEGLTVNFTAPSSGASTTQINFTDVTDVNGLASILPTANALEGSFVIDAKILEPIASNTVSANLTNFKEPPPEEPPPEEPPPEEPPPEETPPPELDRCPPDCDSRNSSPSTGVEGQLELEVENIKETLKKILEETQIKPALIYAIFKPTASSSIGAANPVSSPMASAENKDLEKDENFLKQDTAENPAVGESQWEFSGDRLTDALNATTDHFLNPRETLSGDDQLELIMITATGKVIRRPVPGATRARVMPYVQNFVRGVTNPRFAQAYLAPAQALYDVLVRPLEKELVEEDIGNLTFIMDDGLRTLPVAALHDGQNFIIENYSVGLMPSFSLTNTSGYVEPKNNLLLAMGASEFTNQEDLPAAPLEVQIIGQIWQGDSFVNQQFTVDNLIEARQEKPYGIIHLATHGEFREGDRSNSFISFADQNVALDELDKLQLGNPPLELLVLSACRTALGDRNAELGFSGLALASGAKSAMGSIWYVDDAGTMGLMTRFYSELQNAPIKAEALRQAQLALLHGEVRQEGNQLTSRGVAPIQLPPEIADTLNLDLTHPFFWSGFALVGNPW